MRLQIAPLAGKDCSFREAPASFVRPPTGGLHGRAALLPGVAAQDAGDTDKVDDAATKD